MLFWRLARAAHQTLDGEGARLNGGRWNSEGVSVVYASATLALAALEYLVHLDAEDAPADLLAMQIRVADELPTERVESTALQPGWNAVLDPADCVHAGDEWANSGSTLLLRVPSAIVPEEENVLLNPRHPEASSVEIVRTRAFAFDPRLLQGRGE